MILSAGEALIDFTPVRTGGVSAYQPHPGGSPLNVAVALGRLGVPVGFLGRVSTDLFGQQLRAHLNANGVSLDYLRQGPEPTTLAFVNLDAEEPQYAFYGEGAADTLLDDATWTQLPEGAAVHFGSISLVREPGATALERLMRRESGRRFLSLDPNVRPGLIPDRAAYTERLEGWVRLVTLVKVSAADLGWLYPDRDTATSARAWLQLGASLVVVTSGARGSSAYWPDGELNVPSEPVTVVDTVGAGDAFTAGLLAALHEAGHLRAPFTAPDEPALQAALHLGNSVAALTCTRAGADPPHRGDLPATTTPR